MAGYKDFGIDQNIRMRQYENGTIRYRVQIKKGKRKERKSFSITFATEQDAREWLEKNYYEFFKEPEKYFLEKKKKWL